MKWEPVGKTDMDSVAPIYNKIGEGYSLQRRSDPQIFAQIKNALLSCETVLNIGAGTGSYEPPNCTLAIEPSEKMIAQRPSTSAPCIQAFAESLPLPDKSFDGSLASLTIHHWTSISAGILEMRRVTRSRIVLFTWDPIINADIWLLRDYFPSILALDRPRFPTLEELEALLGPIQVQTVPIPADCQDGFIGSFWKRPYAYLDPEVQRANSAMALLSPHELNEGTERLREDLRTGAWLVKNAKLMDLHELDLGYRLVIANF